MKREPELFLRRPRFRGSTSCSLNRDTARISFQDFTCEIVYNPAARKPLAALLRGLERGIDARQLSVRFRDFAPHARDVIEALDRYGFLTDGAEVPAEAGSSGFELWRRTSRFAARQKQSLEFPFSRALSAAQVRRPALIAYAVEYYHLVDGAPRALLPMLAHPWPSATRATLENLLLTEVGHETMLARSLRAAAVDVEAVREKGPSPETYALIATLGVLAAQDPLSLSAVLFLLEEPNKDFHALLVQACRHEGLPSAFWKPIVRHARLNEADQHGSISESLLLKQPNVTEEQSIVALKHVLSVLEILSRLEARILNYRG